MNNTKVMTTYSYLPEPRYIKQQCRMSVSGIYVTKLLEFIILNYWILTTMIRPSAVTTDIVPGLPSRKTIAITGKSDVMI